MSIPMILLPVFVLVGLTFVLILAGARGGRNTSGAVRTAGRLEAFADQLPLLFYILIALAMPLRHADLIIVMLSWVFVVTRFAHAGLLATSGDGRGNSLAWFASAIVLFAMWFYFALKILLLI
jgi:hypothetical protein